MAEEEDAPLPALSSLAGRKVARAGFVLEEQQDERLVGVYCVSCDKRLYVFPHAAALDARECLEGEPRALTSAEVGKHGAGFAVNGRIFRALDKDDAGGMSEIVHGGELLIEGKKRYCELRRTGELRTYRFGPSPHSVWRDHQLDVYQLDKTVHFTLQDHSFTLLGVKKFESSSDIAWPKLLSYFATEKQSTNLSKVAMVAGLATAAGGAPVLGIVGLVCGAAMLAKKHQAKVVDIKEWKANAVNEVSIARRASVPADVVASLEVEVGRLKLVKNDDTLPPYLRLAPANDVTLTLRLGGCSVENMDSQRCCELEATSTRDALKMDLRRNNVVIATRSISLFELAQRDAEGDVSSDDSDAEPFAYDAFHSRLRETGERDRKSAWYSMHEPSEEQEEEPQQTTEGAEWSPFTEGTADDASGSSKRATAKIELCSLKLKWRAPGYLSRDGFRRRAELDRPVKDATLRPEATVDLLKRFFVFVNWLESASRLLDSILRWDDVRLSAALSLGSVAVLVLWARDHFFALPVAAALVFLFAMGHDHHRGKWLRRRLVSQRAEDALDSHLDVRQAAVARLAVLRLEGMCLRRPPIVRLRLVPAASVAGNAARLATAALAEFCGDAAAKDGRAAALLAACRDAAARASRHESLPRLRTVDLGAGSSIALKRSRDGGRWGYALSGARSPHNSSGNLRDAGEPAPTIGRARVGLGPRTQYEFERLARWAGVEQSKVDAMLSGPPKQQRPPQEPMIPLARADSLQPESSSSEAEKSDESPTDEPTDDEPAEPASSSKRSPKKKPQMRRGSGGGFEDRWRCSDGVVMDRSWAIPVLRELRSRPYAAQPRHVPWTESRSELRIEVFAASRRHRRAPENGRVGAALQRRLSARIDEEEAADGSAFERRRLIGVATVRLDKLAAWSDAEERCLPLRQLPGLSSGGDSEDDPENYADELCEDGFSEVDEPRTLPDALSALEGRCCSRGGRRPRIYLRGCLEPKRHWSQRAEDLEDDLERSDDEQPPVKTQATTAAASPVVVSQRPPSDQTAATVGGTPRRNNSTVAGRAGLLTRLRSARTSAIEVQNSLRDAVRGCEQLRALLQWAHPRSSAVLAGGLAAALVLACWIRADVLGVLLVAAAMGPGLVALLEREIEAARQRSVSRAVAQRGRAAVRVARDASNARDAAVNDEDALGTAAARCVEIAVRCAEIAEDCATCTYGSAARLKAATFAKPAQVPLWRQRLASLLESLPSEAELEQVFADRRTGAAWRRERLAVKRHLRARWAGPLWRQSSVVWRRHFAAIRDGELAFWYSAQHALIGVSPVLVVPLRAAVVKHDEGPLGPVLTLHAPLADSPNSPPREWRLAAATARDTAQLRRQIHRQEPPGGRPG